MRQMSKYESMVIVQRIRAPNFNLKRTHQEAAFKGYCEFNIAIICRAYWKTCNWLSFYIRAAVCAGKLK